MNFGQIAKGNFASLTGNWRQIAYSANFQNGTQAGLIAGGTDTMKVAPRALTFGDVKVDGASLTDATGSYALKYQQKAGVLTALLKDDSVAINWSVTYYPVGTTAAFKTITGDAQNRQNIVQLWTSNNSYTTVFAENVSDAQMKQYQGLNVDQIAAGDYSSLAGVWRNRTDDKTLTVTSKIVTAPASMNLAQSKGVALAGADQNGYPEVISGGPVTQGYIQGALGYFDPHSMSAPSPLSIVPKGVQLPSLGQTADDSDMTQDRLILGGGQGGFASQAYYRAD